MITINQKPIRKILYTTLCAMLLCSSASAAKLDFKNDRDGEVEVTIEPGSGKTLKSTNAISFKLSKHEAKTMEINNDTFGTDTFSISAKVTPVPAKSDVLFVNKDYKIVFVNSPTGGVAMKVDDK